LKGYKVASFNHTKYPLKEVGKFQLPENDFEVLHMLKAKYGIDELQYLNTCNRVELILHSENFSDRNFPALFSDLYQGEDLCEINFDQLEVYSGKQAVRHWLSVASSLKSLVLGEREILTQCRSSFDKSKHELLSGDSLRMLNTAAVETAKNIFTNTGVATRPVSVVFLAFRELLRKVNILSDKNILLVGFGQTNQTMLKFLEKEGCKNISIINRSEEKVKDQVADKYPYYSLEALANDELGNQKFDAIVSCTSATKAVLSLEFVKKHLQESKKTALVDLALPSDYASEIPELYNEAFIGIESLKAESLRNLEERKSELDACESIIEDRLSEFNKLYNERLAIKAFKDIPTEIARIKEKAISEVFAKDINALSDQEKLVVNQILDYMERKCVAVPMKVAKKVFS
jgi:glutamyl-tRNA reductase